MLRSEPRSVLANLEGGFENGPDGKYPSQFVRSNGRQTHGCDASTRGAIRIPAKKAWSDLGRQVSRQRPGRERKNTVLGSLWRRSKLPNHGLWHVQFRILLSQLLHVRNGPPSLLRTQDFRQLISNLRSEQAEPYLLDLWAWRPEFQEFG